MVTSFSNLFDIKISPFSFSIKSNSKWRHIMYLMHILVVSMVSDNKAQCKSPDQCRDLDYSCFCWPLKHFQNLINAEGGQDKSASQVSGHSSHVFSSKCQEPQNLNCYTKCFLPVRPWNLTSDLVKIISSFISQGGCQFNEIWVKTLRYVWHTYIQTDRPTDGQTSRQTKAFVYRAACHRCR